MNNLDHVKNFYPENYKLDLSETMKAALSKGPGGVGVGVNVGGLGGGGGSGTGGAGGSGGAHGMGAPVSHSEIQGASGTGIPGVGYVTEKLYMLLQLYLQNKGWNPSAELLQCFTDLKDNAMLPSAAYLQILANRLTLDAQGRLILRENGKIVLPFEHFANAVMLKHMSGPHGLHLSVEATVRAVIESYTIGRENFGMEKEFIIEVVQSCPSPACRYYKNHLGMSPLPFMEQQFPGVNPADFLQHLPHLPPPPPPSHQMVAGSANSGVSSTGSASSGGSSSNVGPTGSSVGAGGEVDLTKSSSASHAPTPKVPVVPTQLQMLTKQQQNSIQSQLSQLSAAAAAAAHHQQQQQQAAAAAAAAAAAKQQQQQQAQAQAQAQAAAVAQQQQQQQLTAALLQQQQSRALAQQSLEKFNNLTALEKQRVLQQLDPKHFDPMAVAAAAANLQMQGINDFRVAAIAAAAAQAAGNSAMVPPSSTTACGSSITVSSGINSSNNNMIGSGSSNSGMGSSSGNLSSAAVLPSSVGIMSTSGSSSSSVHNSVSSSSNSNMIGISGSASNSNSHHTHQLPPPSQSPSAHSSHSSSSSSSHSTEQIVQKNVELLRSNLESIESNKDLLALHNGAWTVPDNNREPLPVGQDKIVRIFAELMRNMARMKTYIRPSMCKPYGKQSESLQKTLLDTIQIVQTLRNCLPAPHIPVSSWKSESEGSAGLITSNSGVGGNTGTNVMGGVVGSGLMVTNRVENLTN
ncbi:AF4/FMR2 family member lilli [Anastrepha obliqua]|uniref:AF4/FMR2 family member lilli n=1 Tax=Anastrepha obliqua TaxID=95512 RepID=UPI00240A16EE|nr:AF4/FMR2 family member lilli [Anastrepha obliqua]XP_054729449.1 AF4/FMR2 family member lilli [Anastrepha obliqua]